MLDTNVTFAILIAVGLAVLVPILFLILHKLLGRERNPNPNKGTTYEAGLAPKSTVGTARERFSVKFYLIAILFIIFDVEAVFLYPWAVNFQKLGMFGFIEMIVFLTVLFAGYVYIVKRGALKWE